LRFFSPRRVTPGITRSTSFPRASLLNLGAHYISSALANPSGNFTFVLSLVPAPVFLLFRKQFSQTALDVSIRNSAYSGNAFFQYFRALDTGSFLHNIFIDRPVVFQKIRRRLLSFIFWR